MTITVKLAIPILLSRQHNAGGIQIQSPLPLNPG
jgi:hypothetical protein